MKTQAFPQLSAIALAVLALTQQAHAQTTDAQATAPAAGEQKAVAQEMQQVVVTGSATNGVRKLDATYSITTASEAQIKEAAASSTADLLKIVPGVFAESTGGNAGANIEVRGFPSGGDAPFVTVQLNGNPLYPAPTLSFLENSSLFRIDDTVDHVEVLRGGPSTVFSNGQPGATMNFILKKGGDDPEGSVRFTTGTGNQRRVDAVYSGKLADNWYGMIGGFHRTSQGVRDAQFPADDGGQVSASLTRRLQDGEVTFWTRVTNDKNAFYTGVPLVAAANSGDQPSAFPGFDPLTGTLGSNELRNVRLEVGPNGQTLNKDLADGRGLHTTVAGMDFQQRINGWNVTNKASYLSGTAPTLAIFTGDAPMTASAYIAKAVASANANAAVVAAAGGRLATGGTATYSNGGGAVAGSQQILSAGIWSVDKDLKSFTDELRVNKEIAPGHTLTAGLYFADFSTQDEWYLGNGTLMTAQNNARPVDVKLDNGVVVSGAGHDGASFFTLDERWNGHNTAGYLADEWKVNDRLSVDAGVRYEQQRVDGTMSVPKSVDLDNNPLTVYNNNASVLSGGNTSIHRTDKEWSYTIGGGYKLAKDMNLFARINSGVAFPQFDTLRDSAGTAPVVKIKQYEVGFKTVGTLYSAYVTAFHTDFKGLPFSQILSDGRQVNDIAGSSGNGVEFELAVRPIQNLQVSFTGDWQDSTYKDFPAGSAAGTNGNRVQRQPKFQARLTPSYRIPMDWGSVKLHATWTTIGDRWSDTQNLQLLPGYKTLDAGVLVSVGDRVDVRLTGTNLTNEFGLTEGNARIIGSGTGGVVFGRPIFGRAWEASLTYRF
ncbi:TonB-dependent receptor [Massilia arenosa]|uniref:TonB-dependent receptor n=1 Tax=Zemynaea arenosa TaxID=2561931 RepID=A0A4Y9SVX0_9BURK|nr:TonB-dependent receptor [Massilia arenosa]TFW29667.1 TonB-dependent receptor [Massilia arenosa]